MNSGKNNPNWRGGLTIKHCIDCAIRVCRNNKGGRCKSCAKTGRLNTFYQKQHTQVAKEKMILSHTKRDKSTYRGVAIPFDVLSRAMKKRWSDANETERSRLVKPFIVAGLKGCKKSSLTKIENIVNEILVRNGVSFERNKQIGIYNVDFLSDKKVIECLGDYWHCNPNIYHDDYYNKSIKMFAADKRTKDIFRKHKLESRGLSVLMLWESDIKKYINKTEDVILKFLKA